MRYRGAWHGDSNFPQAGPAPQELLRNRHPIQRVAATAAVEFHLEKDPGGPGRGTEPAGPVWQLPAAHGGRRELLAVSDGPCPEHPASPGAEQELFLAGEPRMLRPPRPSAGDPVRPSCRSTTTVVGPTAVAPRPRSSACRGATAVGPTTAV